MATSKFSSSPSFLLHHENPPLLDHFSSSPTTPLPVSSNPAIAPPLDRLPLPPERLSDVHLASRKANEAALRRFEAASWLQRMVGPLDLPNDPSDEELRLCLRNGLALCNLINTLHPGAVPKIVENPTLSSPPPEGAALSAYQYFENVRNFLVAVEELKLSSFEASDLEKISLQTGSSARVIDCILSLKAYHEGQQGGGHNIWKLGCPTKSPCAPKSSSKPLPGYPPVGSDRSLEASAPSISKANSQIHKRWAVPGSDGPNNLSEEFGSPFPHTGKGGQLNGLRKGLYVSGRQDESEDAWSSLDFSATWVEHVSQKFVDNFQAQNKFSHEASMVGTRETIEFDNMPPESLLQLVTMVLNDKQPEEVPVIVEHMMRKVMEEFERRISYQEQQLKRSRAKAMEDFPAASRDCSEQQAKIQGLQIELNRAKSIEQQCAFRVESQSTELKELKCSLQTTRLEFQDLQVEWAMQMKSLDSRLQCLAQAAEEYHKIAAENRELYNQVQDLKGNIRVYCRVRPFLSSDKSTQSTVDFIGEKGSIVVFNPLKPGKDQRKSFNFNKVFGPYATQEEVFLDTRPLIRSVLDGYNVCIFAYGQTGSGKTYTMTGPNNPSPKDWGVNFRALHDLFQISQHRKDLLAYEVGVQMIEIYNEQVRDLLSTDGSNKKLEIRNRSQQNGLNVPDANMVPVESTEDVLELMDMGHKNRAVGATALNERSSRSHSVLTVHVKGTDLASGAVLRGCLHLVDLAGSERVDKSEAVGDRLKEAQHINKSLSALGDVIAALAQKSVHIPYRNSKLTQLLQDSLGGQAKTLMFVHISPDDDSYGETISTLKFAERVATVELGAAQSNKESGEVRDLKDQIAFLKEALAKKDGELERSLKEARNKNVECVQDKSRTKIRTSPNLSQRMNVDVVHAQVNRRQPLEEVRNAEVRQNLGVAQKNILNSEFRADPPPQPHSTSGHGVYYVSQEEESVLRSSSKLTRQALSPERRSSNCEYSFDGTSGRGGIISSRNKIRHENPEDLEPLSRMPSERLRGGKNFSVQSNGRGNEVRTYSVDHPEHRHLRHLDRKKESNFPDEMSPLSVPATEASYSEGAPKMRSGSRGNPHFKSSFQSSHDLDSQDESTEDSTARRGDFDEETSDYSDGEMWSKEDLGPPLEQLKSDMVIASNKKLRQIVDKRVSNHQQSGALARTERKTANAVVGQAHPRSRRYSLVGSTTLGVESKRSGGKATLEAKLIATTII